MFFALQLHILAWTVSDCAHIIHGYQGRACNISDIFNTVWNVKILQLFAVLLLPVLASLACQLALTTLDGQLLVGICISLINLVYLLFGVSNCLVGQCSRLVIWLDRCGLCHSFHCYLLASTCWDFRACLMGPWFGLSIRGSIDCPSQIWNWNWWITFVLSKHQQFSACPPTHVVFILSMEETVDNS